MVAEAGGHYVIALKASQPKLMAAADAAVGSARGGSRGGLDVVESTSRAHGRIERRVVEVVHVLDAATVQDSAQEEVGVVDDGEVSQAGPAAGGSGLARLAFPHVTAVFRVTRWFMQTTEKVWAAKETTLLVTSLPGNLASAAVAAVVTRGHWSVECLHWARDVQFGRTRPPCTPVVRRGTWRRSATWS